MFRRLSPSPLFIKMPMPSGKVVQSNMTFPTYRDTVSFRGHEKTEGSKEDHSPEDAISEEVEGYIKEGNFFRDPKTVDADKAAKGILNKLVMLDDKEKGKRAFQVIKEFRWGGYEIAKAYEEHSQSNITLFADKLVAREPSLLSYLQHESSTNKIAAYAEDHPGTLALLRTLINHVEGQKAIGAAAAMKKLGLKGSAIYTHFKKELGSSADANDVRTVNFYAGLLISEAKAKRANIGA